MISLEISKTLQASCCYLTSTSLYTLHLNFSVNDFDCSHTAGRNSLQSLRFLHEFPGSLAAKSASLTASGQGSRPETPSHQLIAKPRPSVYTKKKPNQLHRLATPQSDPLAKGAPLHTKVPANPGAPNKAHPEGLPHGSGKQSPGLLVHKGKHSLIRRSSGSILSAVARTVAAVHSHTALRASKKWSRAAEASKSSGTQPQARKTSRQPILMDSGRSAKVAGRKEAFQWQRGQSSGSSSGQAGWSRRLSPMKAPLSRKPYKRLQGSTAGKAGPAKLVRVAGVLYKVSGVGRGRSLKRQVTPKILPKPAHTSQVHTFSS